jgi:hypothetical protein
MAMFDGFEELDISTDGASVHGLRAATGLLCCSCTVFPKRI